MALGFEQAGFDVLAAVDADPIALAVHERNFPLCEPVCADLAALNSDRVLEAADRGWRRRRPDRAFPGKLDCLFGGPSCQGFSIIGRRDPGDSRNGLIGHFVRMVLELRPATFVLENVPGLASPRHRATLEAVYHRLHAGGYAVAEPWIVDAADHGTPQERRRVFVIGGLIDGVLPTCPTRDTHRVTVADALDDLPRISRYPSLWATDELRLTAVAVARQRAAQSVWVRDLNGAKGNHADRRVWDPGTLTGMSRTLHNLEVSRRFARLGPGERDGVARFDRLRADGQSPTLRAGTGRDHGSHTSARPIHHVQPRVICVREAARLHGLPDWFAVHRVKWHGLRQIGNSVPPPLARAVAARLLGVLGREPCVSRYELELGHDRLRALTLPEAADRYSAPAELMPIDVRRDRKRAERR